MEIEQAIGLCKELHSDEYLGAGKPFWMHPYQVMLRLKKLHNNDVSLLALFHDAGRVDHKIEHLVDKGVPRRIAVMVDMMAPTDVRDQYTFHFWIRKMAEGAPLEVRLVQFAEILDKVALNYSMVMAGNKDYIRKWYKRSGNLLFSSLPHNLRKKVVGGSVEWINE